MVDLDRLERQARQAAEWGRFRMAARVGLVVLPMACASIWLGGPVWTCAALGLALFGVAFGLRWWHQEGVDAVRRGLWLGLLPLVATACLGACGVDASFGPAGDVVCLVAGVAAGVGVTLRSGLQRATSGGWALATGVASLTAALGCAGLGVGGLLVTVAALAASSAASWLPVRAWS
jgi:hypothetical protein